MNNLSTDYFDCPNCGIKNVIYEKEFSQAEQIGYTVQEDEDEDPITIFHLFTHYVIKCSRTDCGRLTYLKIKERIFRPSTRWVDLSPPEVEVQYPSSNSVLPNYIPENIRRHFKEAIDAYNFGLLSASSIMCRKVIYQICDNRKSSGVDYKEKIKKLGFDKRITDPLLNIKNIGDETVHAKGWDKETVEKAIGALGIIIDMIYIQENRIKDFSKHYSKTNQDRLGEATKD